MMPVRYDAAGERYREFADAVAIGRTDAFPDWPFEGPRSLQEFLQLVRRRAGTPSGWHTKWLFESGLDKKMPEAMTHEILCDIIEAGACYDQVNVMNLASFELAGRWLQMIEHSVGQNAKKPEVVNPGLFLGNSSRSSGGGLTSALAKHVATRAAEDASVLKEQRKAKEERALLAKK